MHLEDANEGDGALRLLPGTHRLGRLDAATIAKICETQVEVL